MRKKLIQYLDDTVLRSERAEKLVPPPWSNPSLLPPHMQGLLGNRAIALRELFIVAAWVFFLAGLLPNARVLLALGIVMLVGSHLTRRRMRAQLTNCKTQLELPKETTFFGEEFSALLKIHNNGVRDLSNLAIHVYYGGSSQPGFLHRVDKIKPGEECLIPVTFFSNTTMGKHLIGPVHLTAVDPLGTFNLTVCRKHEQEITVIPKVVPIKFIEARSPNRPLLPGSLDMSIAGSSPTFLGTREWMDGDSIRQIDWKRSSRSEKLIVREYERSASTDAVILLDTYFRWNSQFQNVSSYHKMQSAALSVAETLINRNSMTGLITAGERIDQGMSVAHLQRIKITVNEHPMTKEVPLHDLLVANMETIPAGTFLVMITHSAAVCMDEVLEPLLTLQEKKVEVCLLEFQTFDYALHVIKNSSVSHALQTSEGFGRLMDKQKMATRTRAHSMCQYVFEIRPDDDLIEKFEESA